LGIISWVEGIIDLVELVLAAIGHTTVHTVLKLVLAAIGHTTVHTVLKQEIKEQEIKMEQDLV
jgi:hypothetical protein